MKLTKSQLKSIILEEAAKVKKEMLLREQLEEVQKELEEVMGGPHGDGKKTFKSAKGDFIPGEFPGALVEKDKQEEEMEETYSFEEEELEEMMKGMEDVSQEEEMEEEGVNHEEEEFSEEELEEMFNQMEKEMEEGDKTEEGAKIEETTGSEGAESEEELKKEEIPAIKEESVKYNLSESAEVLRMKKLAGLL